MATPTEFRDRPQAGRALARQLGAWVGHPEVVVLALPRGGVPVAAPVAKALGAPLDVLVVRKLGHPLEPEFALGAIAGGGVQVMNPLTGLPPVSEADLAEVVAHEQAELQRREQAYRGDRPPCALGGRVAILVDDGLATGATMLAAVRAARGAGAARVVVAVPVASREAMALVGAEADEVHSVQVPEPFRAVGLWYRDFEQTGDEQVRSLLAQAGG